MCWYFSHGRRFYRSLIYTTNTRFSLMFMQESTDARKTPPPRWCLHGQGDPMASITEQSSHVITREAHLPGNFSGTEEMYSTIVQKAHQGDKKVWVSSLSCLKQLWGDHKRIL